MFCHSFPGLRELKKCLVVCFVKRLSPLRERMLLLLISVGHLETQQSSLLATKRGGYKEKRNRSGILPPIHIQRRYISFRQSCACPHVYCMLSYLGHCIENSHAKLLSRGLSVWESVSFYFSLQHNNCQLYLM